MTTRRAATDGLSTSDIDGIRSSLAAGRKPKVVFTEAAGQIAGQVGQVVQLADPDQSDEWVVVRFGRDELPFSPADLAMPARGTRSKAGKSTTSSKSSSGGPGGPGGAGTKRTRSRAQPASSSVPAPRAAPPAEPSSAPAAGSSAEAEPATNAAAATAKPAKSGKAAKRTATSARAGKPKKPATMTVTLAYEDGEWTVAAHQGSKTLAKPYVVRSADALKMVAMLDVPGVHDAVEQIVTAELTDAQRRADALRSELAEVEARLTELRDVGS